MFSQLLVGSNTTPLTSSSSSFSSAPACTTPSLSRSSRAYTRPPGLCANMSTASTFHLLAARKQTFAKTRKAPHRGLNWPHPLLPKSTTIHPLALATAGFWHDPLPGSDTLPPASLEDGALGAGVDRVRCFTCDAVLQDWRQGQDPLARHGEVSPQCSFYNLAAMAAAFSATNAIESDKSSWDWGTQGQDWPQSERVRAFRENSFVRGWPHEGVPGIPTPAEASRNPFISM